MANITSYPFQDGYETELAQSLNTTDTTMYVNVAPSFTIPASTTTYAVLNPGKSNVEVVEISAFSGTTVTLANRNISQGASVTTTAQTHAVGSKVIISDNYQFWKDIVDAINSKLDSNGGNPTTTFDLDVSGSNWRIRKDGNDMKFTDDNNPEITLSTLAAAAGADTKVAITVSDTTTGVLDSKLTAGDGLTKTVVNPGGNESMDLDIDLTDTTIFATDGTASRAVVTDGSGNLFQATTSARGGVEMCTDAEALTGTDETRYINAKQAKDNYLTVTDCGIATHDLSTTGTQAITHALGKAPKIIRIVYFTAGNESPNETICHGVYSQNGEQTVGKYYNTTGTSNYKQYSVNSFIVRFGEDAVNDTYASATVSATSTTDFTLTWTVNNSPTGTLTMHWEALA